MIVGGPGAPNATLPLAGMGVGAQGGRHNYAEDPMTMATTRSLNARASSPTQTPVVRRTGHIAPIQAEVPKKKSIIGSIFIALILLGVIAYGVQKLRPVIEDARKLNAAQKARRQRFHRRPRSQRQRANGSVATVQPEPKHQ